ncbi:MAG: hypothetical protein E6R14_10550 [Thermomicrobiales bacterium]|nr:MAG: hypothetical protein E6R14_10550 [Thermomicrobiales bacterium]
MKVTRRAVCAGIVVAPAALAAGARTSRIASILEMSTTGEDMIARILLVVSRFSGVSQADILSSLRTREVVEARQKALYLAHKLSGKTLPEIGRRFGGRDHTTVLHASRKWQAVSEGDVRVRAELAQLAKMAGASANVPV